MTQYNTHQKTIVHTIIQAIFYTIIACGEELKTLFQLTTNFVNKSQ